MMTNINPELQRKLNCERLKAVYEKIKQEEHQNIKLKLHNKLADIAMEKLLRYLP